MRRKNSTRIHLQQAERALGVLDLGATFALADLHRRIEQQRGRNVLLIPRSLPALAPHGLWISGQHADYVFYAEDATPVRKKLIIGHEYGHMIFDDPSPPADVDQIAAMLMPDVDQSVPVSIMARSTYDEPTEHRAEVFGTVVAQRADSWTNLTVPTPADPEVTARLIATLEGRPW